MADKLNQSDLNAEMIEIGVGRYRNRVEKTRAREAELETNYGQRLMRGLIPKFKKGIDDWVQGFTHKNLARYQQELLHMDTKVISFIAIRAVIDSITHKRSLASCALFLGARIEDQNRCVFLQETNSDVAGGILKGAQKRKGLKQQIRHVRSSMKHETDKKDAPEFQKWSHRDKLNTGVNLIEILRVTTGIIEYIYLGGRKNRKPTRYVSATAETIKWIEDYNNNKEMLEPFWLPTVELPKDWTNVWDGGYATTDTSLPKLPFIKTNNMDYLRRIPVNLEKPMDATNLIQQTPWRVNSPVLQAMEWAWENNVNVGGLPSREDEPLPPIPLDMKENADANKRWRQQAARIYDYNLSTKSRRLLIAKILYLAKKLEGNRFFYPTQADFRGRLYNIPAFLGVQGPDVCRGLLEFNRPEKIKNETDAFWLGIHGANVWGNDKVSLMDRYKHSENSSEMVEKIAENPTENLEWTEADKPWSYLAWCFEWAKWTKYGKLDSYLPCAMDASNNGLQILSLLMRDEYGAQTTNVTPNKLPADIYGVVANQVIWHLSQDISNGNHIAKTWLDFGIDRKTTKRAVMTFFYGATYYSCRAYTDEWFQDKLRSRKIPNPFDHDEHYVVVGYLAKLVWQSINEVLDKPKQCMSWMHQVAKEVSSQGKDLNWVSPSGFPVCQSYKNTRAAKVSSKIYGQGVHIYFENELDTVSPRLQRQGIAPNFVHSLDGAMLHLSVIRAHQHHQIYDFSMIHDSYGTHSNKCQFFGEALRSVFYETFKEDQLEIFKSQIEKDANVELPEVPSYGNLDPKDVMHSVYFFS